MSEPILLQSLGPTPLQTPALSLSPSHGSLYHIPERSQGDTNDDSVELSGVHSDPHIFPGMPDGNANISPVHETPLPDYIPALPPVDGGRQAWSFLVAATTMEMLIWGLPFAVGVLHEYWLSTLFKGQGEGTITLAATLQTGLLYMSTAAFGP